MKKIVKYTYLKLKSSLRERLFGKYAIGVIYDTKNGKIAAPIDDLMVGRKLGFKGEYDMSEISALEKLINPDDIIYIIGTHWGTLLIPLSKSCKQIIGYEANPTTFSFLEKNLLLNKTNNVSVFNKAVGNKSGKIEFYKSTINSGGSKIKPKTDKYMYTYDNPDTIEVDMIAVDEHVHSNKLPKANGILMDIEGAEFYALQGMPETLKNSDFLYIEYVPHHLENVSNTTNKDFFDLILPYYTTVKFMNQQKTTFDLQTNKTGFFAHVESMKKNNISDNLLFTK